MEDNERGAPTRPAPSPAPAMALTLWHASPQYATAPHCLHLRRSPSAPQLPQKSSEGAPLPLLLPLSLILSLSSGASVLALPLPERVFPPAPLSSGWGRWKTVGSYEVVVVDEEETESPGSGTGSSAAPLPVLALLLFVEAIVCFVAAVSSVGATPHFFDARYF